MLFSISSVLLASTALQGVLAFERPWIRLPEKRELCFQPEPQNFTIEQYQFYPENADFHQGTCELFVSNFYNGTVSVITDGKINRTLAFNGISNVPGTVLAGIRIHKFTGFLAILATSPFPAHRRRSTLVLWNPWRHNVVWKVDLTEFMDDRYGPFTDVEFDPAGNVYVTGAYPGSILKIDSGFFMRPPVVSRYFSGMTAEDKADESETDESETDEFEGEESKPLYVLVKSKPQLESQPEPEIDEPEIESKIDESEGEESKPLLYPGVKSKPQPESQPEPEIDESKGEETKPSWLTRLKMYLSKPQPGPQPETDESETDESETDESETDESETDESETDESETDESEGEEPPSLLTRLIMYLQLQSKQVFMEAVRKVGWFPNSESVEREARPRYITWHEKLMNLRPETEEPETVGSETEEQKDVEYSFSGSAACDWMLLTYNNENGDLLKFNMWHPEGRPVRIPVSPPADFIKSDGMYFPPKYNSTVLLIASAFGVKVFRSQDKRWNEAEYLGLVDKEQYKEPYLGSFDLEGQSPSQVVQIGKGLNLVTLYVDEHRAPGSRSSFTFWDITDKVDTLLH